MNKLLLFTKFLPMLMADGTGGDGSGDNTNPNSGQGNGENQNQDPQGKTFTQEQVNSFIANERKKATAGAFKEFGFESSEDAKTFIEKYRAQEENNKTELEKVQTELSTEKQALAEEHAKAQNLELKFEALNEGCVAQNADDVVTLAKAKMSDTVDFKAALAEVKRLYPAMFQAAPNSSTGGGGNPPRHNGSEGLSGIGKRLAGNNKTTKDNPYFNN